MSQMIKMFEDLGTKIGNVETTIGAKLGDVETKLGDVVTTVEGVEASQNEMKAQMAGEKSIPCVRVTFSGI